MGKVTGFIEEGREFPSRRPVEERVHDWKEVYNNWPDKDARTQASRCMDCGVPFCNYGCPLGNLIPDWNDLVYRGEWEKAIAQLHSTNNFPEFTGRICPAPCEPACTLAINQDPITIEMIEKKISDKAWNSGYIKPDAHGLAISLDGYNGVSDKSDPHCILYLEKFSDELQVLVYLYNSKDEPRVINLDLAKD